MEKEYDLNVISVGEYIIYTFLFLLLPFIGNIIIVFMGKSKQNPIVINYAYAFLIFNIIIIVLISVLIYFVNYISYF